MAGFSDFQDHENEALHNHFNNKDNIPGHILESAGKRNESIDRVSYGPPHVGGKGGGGRAPDPEVHSTAKYYPKRGRQIGDSHHEKLSNVKGAEHLADPTKLPDPGSEAKRREEEAAAAGGAEGSGCNPGTGGAGSAPGPSTGGDSLRQDMVRVQQPVGAH